MVRVFSMMCAAAALGAATATNPCVGQDRTTCTTHADCKWSSSKNKCKDRYNAECRAKVTEHEETLAAKEIEIADMTAEVDGLKKPHFGECTHESKVCNQLRFIKDPASTKSRPIITNYSPLKPVGGHTARIPEAADAGDNAALKIDGQDGDVDFPFGNLKPLYTVGEYDKNTGYVLTGVPDGMGAYLKDKDTVRVIVQSESYGKIKYETHPFATSTTGASFTGSHVDFIDYDREGLISFMDGDASAEHLVKGAGNVITGNVYNLNNHVVDVRTGHGATDTHAQPHFTNTDKDGVWALYDAHVPSQADWFIQSLCSAHLADAGIFPEEGAGVEDDLFLTNEEWIHYAAGKNFVGLSAHAIDLAKGDMWAVAAFTNGGFEKIVEVNCKIAGHVCFSVSGYNGAFGGDIREEAVARRNAIKKRADGSDFPYPQNIVPARLYIGKKGFNEAGEPATDFLSRNGLRYGKLYGFAVDSTDSEYKVRDQWHKTHADGTTPRATGETMQGRFLPIEWRWDGEVKNFEHDGSWDFTDAPVGANEGEIFWTGEGPDGNWAKKTEHNAPCPYGKGRFMQSSTGGYLGVYDFDANIAADIQAAMDGTNAMDADTNDADGASPLNFPKSIDATYITIEGEVDIKDKIDLGGKGQTAPGGNGDGQKTTDDQLTHMDSGLTFEDIDGMYWVADTSADGHVIIQEDSGNDYGERTFIAEVKLGANDAMDYKFIAQSGGNKNSRSGLAGVSVPAGTWGHASTHEFSGAIDFSGMIAKDSEGKYIMKASKGGEDRIAAESNIDINDKLLAVGLQAHDTYKGVIAEFRGDRGGQLLAYQPEI